MSNGKISLHVLSRDNVIFKDDVYMVLLPGVEGDMGVLRNHAPVLTKLRAGEIKVRKTSQAEQIIKVKSGMVEINENKVTCLVDVGENE